MEAQSSVQIVPRVSSSTLKQTIVFSKLSIHQSTDRLLVPNVRMVTIQTVQEVQAVQLVQQAKLQLAAFVQQPFFVMGLCQLGPLFLAVPDLILVTVHFLGGAVAVVAQILTRALLLTQMLTRVKTQTVRLKYCATAPATALLLHFLLATTVTLAQMAHQLTAKQGKHARQHYQQRSMLRVNVRANATAPATALLLHFLLVRTATLAQMVHQLTAV
jgi:hypothetical protein